MRNLMTVVLCGVLAMTAAAAGAEQQQEARAMALIRALAGGEETAALGALEEHLTPEKWQKRPADDWKQVVSMLSRDLGDDPDVRGVEAEGDGRLRVWVQVPRGMMTFSFDFEAAAPYRITGLGVEMGAGEGHGHGGGDGEDDGEGVPGPALQPGMSRGDVVDELERYFAELAAVDVFSGTALVAVDGEPIFTAAHGLASHRFKVPNDVDTRFDLGSINKDFTKIAIGQLHLQKKLTLSDTIADHLPDYPNKEVAGKVTIRQLLDHSSGIGDIFTEKFFDVSKANLRTPRDYFPLFADEPLLFTPGASKQYSNGGYMVLGAIIEAVSGMSYDDYVVAKIFEPAGMASSGFFAHDEPVENVAIGYTRQNDEGELRNNLLMLPVKGSPAGSAYANVADLLRFDNAVRNHRLLPPAYTGWLFGGPEPDPDRAGEGPKGRLDVGVDLAGGAPGVSAVMAIEGKVLIVILSNYDAPVAERIVRALRRPLLQALR